MSDSTDTPDTQPGGRSSSLTERQRTILDVIRTSVTTRGYPPSIREIGDAVGLTSTSSVAHQLRTLEKKGYLRRDPNRPRAIEVVSPDTPSDIRGYRGGGRPRPQDGNRPAAAAPGGADSHLHAEARCGRRRRSGIRG